MTSPEEMGDGALFGLTLDLSPAHSEDGPRSGNHTDSEGDESSLHAVNITAAGTVDDVGTVPTDNSGVPLSDEQLLLIGDKKEAKQLGKRAYKRWKKLLKKAKRSTTHSSKKRRESNDRSHRKSHHHKEKKRRDKSRTHRDKDTDDGIEKLDVPFMGAEEAFFIATDGMNGASDTGRVDLDMNARRTMRRGQLVRQHQEVRSVKRITAEQLKTQYRLRAEDIVESMQNARAQDVSAVTLPPTSASFCPPLYRVAIKDAVEAMCRREVMVGPLVNAGILQELSYWLYDFDNAEPAPYELRTTALDILLSFPIEGELEGKTDKKGEEDLEAFTGLSKENLIETDLGRAVNALRQHQNELHANRSKCIKLLERLSRAMSGGVTSARRPSTTRVNWKCRGDAGVASPFEVVQTGSEAFQRAWMKPDPRDPTSYHKVLPYRPPAAAITNMSGRLAKQIVNNQHRDSES